MAWLAARKEGIGASEIACVLGISPWGSALSLYAEKIGLAEHENLDGNEAVFWGSQLETAIIDGYAKRTGRQVRVFQRLIRSTRWPWMLATPDAETSDDGVTWWPLQVKNIGLNSASHWEDGAPDYYRVQVTQEALVYGATKITAAALVAGQKLIWEDIEVDDIMSRQIVNLGERFWVDHVVARNPPSADGSKASRTALAQMFPRHEPGKAVALSAEFIDIDQQIVEAKAARKELEAQIEALEIRVREAIADAELASLPNGIVYTYKTATVGFKEVAGYTFRKLHRKELKGSK